jgi:signal recognition particle GTPase
MCLQEEEALEMQKRLLDSKFDLNDFVKQFKMMTAMGPMGQVR